MKRQRKNRREESPEGRYTPWFARVPAGVYWTIVTVITLVLVFGWDRRTQHVARDHIAAAEQFRQEGAYEEAIGRYKRALDNARLSRKAKAEVAVRIADTYYEEFENFDLANSFYVRARQLYPKIAEDPKVQDRLRISRQRMTGTPVQADLVERESDAGRTSRGLALVPPPGDSDGPVVAKIGKREVHAGEILRVFRENGVSAAEEYERDPKSLEAKVQDYLNRQALYEAGVGMGLDRDAATLQRVFDYHRSLVAERALADAVGKVERVSEEDVRRYFEDNKSKFSTPARVGVAMIKLGNEPKAREIQAALRGGMRFADAATSHSLDADSARAGGVVGMVTATDETIPGVGKAPEIVRALMNMKVGDVSAPVRVGDAWYLFQVLKKTASREEGIEEARPQIVAALRGGSLERSSQKAREELRAKYPPLIVEHGLAALASHSGGALRIDTNSTSGAVVATSGTLEVRR